MLGAINRVIVLSIFGSILFGACASGSSPAPPSGSSAVAPSATAAAGTPGPKTQVGVWLAIGDRYQPFVDEVIEPFNASSSSYEVIPELIDSLDPLRTALAAGSGPDVVYTEGPTTAFQMAEAKWLTPLEDYAKQYDWTSRFAPWSLSLGSVDGTLFSIPSEMETLVLFYNKALFDAHGWKPPTTIDELTALSAQIYSEGIIPIAAANQEFRKANGWLLTPFLNSVAGPDKVKAALQGRIKWTDPAFVSAVDLLKTYMRSGYFMGGASRYYSATFAERDAAFATGKAAMAVEFQIDYLKPAFEEVGNFEDLDWVPFPTTSGDQSYVLGVGSTWGINAASKNPDGAAAFIDYVFSKATQVTMVTKLGWGPAPIELSVADLPDIDPRAARYIQELAAAAKANKYGYTIWTFWPPKTAEFIRTDSIEKVWADQLSTDEFLQQTQRVFDEELAAKQVPPLP